ncbi:MAG TPA: hypothetical protein VJ812_03990 [Gemmatimonadaceae bacterium]|nr:hypothetical protein [Gemmatimonadaceae bacterium]
MLSFLAGAFLLQVQIDIRRDEKPESARAARAEARRDSLRARYDSIRQARSQRRPRRIPVTAEHLATAFRTPAAGALLARARRQRLVHDSTLESYDAKTYQRFSAGFSFRRGGRERLAFRHEDAARVRWQRGQGVRVDVTGARTVLPIADADADMSGDDLYPIPYHPGQEQLWIGSGVAKTEVNERDLVHPIAEGAEAYYRYSLGDSTSLRLPDGRVISLIELRVEARRPRWNLIVGSLWFDRSSAQLVRAAYRPSIPMDIAMIARQEADNDADDDIPRWLRPMTATITAVTVEYSLHQGEAGGFWWLPRTQYAEGEVVVNVMRLPLRIEQGFQYTSVNGRVELPPPPALASRDSAILADTIGLSDSTRAEARRRRAAGYDVGEDKVYVSTRHEATLPVVVAVPKDTVKLWRSPDLPKSIYEENEALFSRRDADELKESLGFGLQAGWDPQPPTVHYLMEDGLLRYNRVEGLSAGIAVRQTFGRGYRGRVMARVGVADWEPNGELGLERGDGRRSLGITGYRRLVAANDWGDPLSVGSSLSALLFGRDEGFYYRTIGAELSGTFDRGSIFAWRVFAERQQNARKRTDFSVPHWINDVEFIDNIRSQRAELAGVAIRFGTSHGLDPHGWRLFTDTRAEGAIGGFDFARGAVDVTVSHGIGKRLDGAITLGAGTTAGDVPVQRLWYLGGVHTVRGQPASLTAANAIGNSFWMGRAELGSSFIAARPVVFFDIGWAGDRARWSEPARPISGAGAGASFLDGLIRLDVARGIRPSRGWRADLYLESRF